jgi:hypothetical protein
MSARDLPARSRSSFASAKAGARPQEHEIGFHGDGRNAADLWRIQASAMTVAALPQ